MALGWRILVQGMLFVVTLSLALLLEKIGLGGPPLEITDIDPDRIKRRSGREGLVMGSKWVILPRVRGGEWDRDTELWADRARGVYESFKQRYVEGNDWVETVYYAEAMRGIDDGRALYASRFDSEASVRAHFDSIDRIQSEIERGDYKRATEVMTDDRGRNRLVSYAKRTLHRFDEVTIDFGRYGEPLFVDGTHRLGLAKVSSIGSIPVRIHVRHAKWERRRDRIIRYCSDNPTPYPVDHPDLPQFDHLFDADIVMKEVAAAVESGPLIEYTEYVQPVSSTRWDRGSAYAIPASDGIEDMNRTFEECSRYNLVQRADVGELPDGSRTLVVTLFKGASVDLPAVVAQTDPATLVLLVHDGWTGERSLPDDYVTDRTSRLNRSVCEVYRREEP